MDTYPNACNIDVMSMISTGKKVFVPLFLFVNVVLLDFL